MTWRGWRFRSTTWPRVWRITNLEEFGNLQRRFTSDVSHELRTPLTTVRMAADLIYDHAEDLDPALRRSTELLVSELDRFEGLLNDLLEISRHDAGVAELSVEAVDLRTTVNNALTKVGHLADETGIDMLVELPDHEIIAEVDPRRVERILRNLIANAIDHAEHKPVRIRMAADEDTAAVTVRDYGGPATGRGEAGLQPVLAVGPVSGAALRGTGLGLAISIEDARLHQGRLEAWGARQRRLFPADPAPGPRPQSHDQPAADEARCRRTSRRRRAPAPTASPGSRRGASVRRRPFAAVLVSAVALLTGCAGVPNSLRRKPLEPCNCPRPRSRPNPSRR